MTAVSELKDGVDVYDIVLQLAARAAKRIELLPNLKVRAVNGQLASSRTCFAWRTASVPPDEAQARQRQITVLAGMEGMPPRGQEVRTRRPSAVIRTPHHRLRRHGRVMGESFNTWLALVLAVIMVYMILAAHFDSFMQPVTIMLSLPLSVGRPSARLLRRHDAPTSSR